MSIEMISSGRSTRRRVWEAVLRGAQEVHDELGRDPSEEVNSTATTIMTHLDGLLPDEISIEAGQVQVAEVLLPSGRLVESLELSLRHILWNHLGGDQAATDLIHSAAEACAQVVRQLVDNRATQGL